MRTDELIQFLAPTMADHGLILEKKSYTEVYGGRRAWLIIYRGQDCKVQLYRSEREGEINFMVAPLSAANTFGLSDRTGAWQFMLLLSDAVDELKTPRPGANDTEIMSWLRDLFLEHFDSARTALRSGDSARPTEGPLCPI